MEVFVMGFSCPGFLLAYIGPGAGITFLGSFFVLLLSLGLLIFSVLTWPIRFAVLQVRRWRLNLTAQTKRVVVVGLDGLDPGRVTRLMTAGRLPSFQKLADSGTFLP